MRFLLLILTLALFSCNKVTKSKIVGEWKLIQVDESYYDNNFSNNQYTHRNILFDGAYWIETNDYNGTVITDSIYYSEYTYTFFKNQTFCIRRVKEDFNSNYNEIEIVCGHWTFLGKEKQAGLKDNQRIMLTPNEKTVQYYNASNQNSLDSISINLIEGNQSYVLQIKSLSKSALTFQIERSSTYQVNGIVGNEIEFSSNYQLIKI